MAKSLKEDLRPSLQFYPDDWLRDGGLRLCSLEAQGLWMTMLCTMWYGKPRGTLTVNGKQLNNKGLAKIVGESEELINRLVDELESNKVFSRLDDGTICCRRMYAQWQKAEQLRKVRSEAGKKGMKERWGKENNKTITKITPSASSSSSSSTSNSFISNFDNNKLEKNKDKNGNPGDADTITLEMLQRMKMSLDNMSPSTQKIFREKYEEFLEKYKAPKADEEEVKPDEE